MFIPSLNRHLRVAPLHGVPGVLCTPGVGPWHVASALEEPVDTRDWRGVASRLFLEMADISIDYGDPRLAAPSLPQVEQFLAFAARTSPDPLLVHCRMGVSRSAGLALVLLLQGHGLTEDGVAAALSDIIELSPCAWPNPLVIRHGLFLLGGKAAVDAWLGIILGHSAFLPHDP